MKLHGTCATGNPFKLLTPPRTAKVPTTQLPDPLRPRPIYGPNQVAQFRGSQRVLRLRAFRLRAFRLRAFRLRAFRLRAFRLRAFRLRAFRLRAFRQRAFRLRAFLRRVRLYWTELEAAGEAGLSRQPGQDWERVVAAPAEDCPKQHRQKNMVGEGNSLSRQGA